METIYKLLRMGEEEPEPLAKTRTRRSNAGARMHEMIFNAEADPQYAQAFGDLLKTDDDSSDDEEYIPKDLETTNTEADHTIVEDEEDDDDDADSNDNSDDGSSSDDSDDDSDEDEDGNEIDNEHDENNVDTKKSAKDIKTVFSRREKEIRPDIQPGSPGKAAYNSCKRICSVCLGEKSGEHDEIIECDSCGISVHESCYGVGGQESGEEADDQCKASIHSEISSESTEPWFCEPCRRSVRNPICELCPNLGGIFKQTDTGRWIHMVCALYTRGVTFENIENLTNVSLFEINYAFYGSKVSEQKP